MSPKKKLTLSVDEEAVEQARRYSREHNTSLSQLVTTYFKHLGARSNPEFSSLVQRLRGVLPADISVEHARQRVEEKHS